MGGDREHPAPNHAVPPEMPRCFPITRIGEGASFIVQATPGECRALARRMGLEAIHDLTCRFELARDNGDERITAAGLLHAHVRQVCVVSAEPFDAAVTEAFSIRFVPEGRQSNELSLDSDDEVGYAAGVLDLGEAASEQLALALNPFPRMPGK